MLIRESLTAVVFTASFSVALPSEGQPSQQGEWEPVIPKETLDIQAIHMILMCNGRVLILSFETPPDGPGPNTVVFDPASGGITIPDPMPADFFCGANAQLPDGRVLFAGGGLTPFDRHEFASIFDPDGGDPGHSWWNPVDNIPGPGDTRWYGTATTLGNGNVLLSAGREDWSTDSPAEEDVPAVFTPGAAPGLQWKRLSDPGARKVVHWYPFMYQLSSGKLFMGGGAYFHHVDPEDPNPPYDPAIHMDSWRLNVALEDWEDSPVSRASIPGMCSVSYRPDMIMKAGCGLGCEFVGGLDDDVQVIDLTAGSPQWTTVAPMNFERRHFYLVPMPDGRVLALGGTGDAGDVLAAEWYDPDAANPQWDVLASMAEPRLYHSSSVLLPDARVLIGGGQHIQFSRTAQIFKPPYLFDSNGNEIQPPVRPEITSGPDEIVYNSSFTVQSPQSGDITNISLIRLGAATHSYDQSTRFVPLEFSTNGFGAITIAAPPQPNIAPPGYYMRFILKPGDRNGILYPSESKIVKLQFSATP